MPNNIILCYLTNRQIFNGSGIPNTHTQIALEHFLHDTFIICTRVNVHVTLYNCKIKYLQILDQHYEKALNNHP